MLVTLFRCANGRAIRECLDSSPLLEEDELSYKTDGSPTEKTRDRDPSLFAVRENKRPDAQFRSTLASELAVRTKSRDWKGRALAGG